VKVQIYTDGACSGNPGAGGWACVLLSGEHKKELSGFEPETTNNRMEIMAAIKGLEALKTRPAPLEIYSDSAYLCNAVNNGWINSWQQNGWKTSAKESVKNRDLWERIIELNAQFSPKYIKVKGHADNKYNNRCDELAVAEIKKNKK
jgi:ribonuclease HI